MNQVKMSDEDQKTLDTKVENTGEDLATHIYNEFDHENQIKVFEEVKKKLIEKRSMELNKLHTQVNNLNKLGEILALGTASITSK